MLIAKINTEHQEAMIRQQQEFTKAVESYTTNEKRLCEELDEYQRKNSEFKK